MDFDWETMLKALDDTTDEEWDTLFNEYDKEIRIMGMFSFIYCDIKNKNYQGGLNIIEGDMVRIVAPNDEHLVGQYDGYGRIDTEDGQYNLHELLALWNRGLEHKSFAELLGSYFVDSERLADKHEELRHIGIDIECNNQLYGKDKKFCEFPLKLVRDLERNKNLKYNDIQNISISDPMQGFERMTNDEYVLEHCFGDKDYFEYMEVEYESIFD